MKQMTPLVLIVIALLALLPVPGALAQDDMPPIDDTPAPPPPPMPIDPPFWHFDGLEIPYQRVDVTIEEQVATTHIEQLFRNNNDWLLEGTYFYPLPSGAAVSQLTMWVNGQPIEAKILEKDEARQIYDEIVRQLRDPALLEYVGSDAVQANVFPIPPGEERLVELEYSYLLPAENGLIHYVYPQTADLYTNAPLGEQSIRVEVNSAEPIRTIYSPSHAVAISRDGEFRAVAGYEDSHVTPDQDFELYYTISPEAIGLNLLTYKEPGEDGFFLMLVTPGIEAGDKVVAKDVILVLDTSGSMEGEKLFQAQEAATYVVEHLNAEDRFNIVSFSTGTDLYERRLVQAAEPGAYGQFISSLDAVGGTNISEALLEAAALVDRERPTTIIFLTDGLATEGISDTGLLVNSVAAQMPQNARIFAFGVGDDVDTTLLDSLAQNHRGTTTYVRPGQAIDEAVSGFYAKVGSPVLTDISLDSGDVRTSQLYPAQLPDLFAGSQLVLTGRYRGEADGIRPATITLSGMVDGREQSFSYRNQRFVDDGGQPFIPRLWATRAIGHMMQQIRLHGENPELVQSIVNLSMRYGIITPYTSFLIEEDDIFEQSADGALSLDLAEEALAAPPSVSGAAAVERAAAEIEMFESEMPAAMPTMTAKDGDFGGGPPPVKSVGSKTFFLRDGVWVDSAYDAHPSDTAQGELVEVPFASAAYFDLLNSRPDVGTYLALGENVILVLDEQAYQITAGIVEAPPAAPDPTGTVSILEPTQAVTEAGTIAGIPSEPPAEVATDPVESAPTPPPSADSGLPLCGAALAMPLLLLGGFGFAGWRRRRP